MKIGIIGLTGAGRTTVFEALAVGAAGHPGEARVGTVRVPDERIDVLSRMYNPRKTIYAQVEYYLPASGGSKDPAALNAVRDADALIHVVRNFPDLVGDPPDPARDFRQLDQELIFSDLVVVEKRLERLAAEKGKGKSSALPEEPELLAVCKEMLENETPLRKKPELAAAPSLRGFAFLSAKPQLVLFNNADDDEAAPAIDDLGEETLVMRGKLEGELAQMSEEEAAEFAKEFNITAIARDRVVERSYRLLGLISFFTVGEDEVRAWTIPTGTIALDAAEVIHSDLKKGFIRAEVVHYNDLIAAGSQAEARKRATMRLEGKTYLVADGDVINIRFNV